MWEIQQTLVTQDGPCHKTLGSTSPSSKESSPPWLDPSFICVMFFHVNLLWQTLRQFAASWSTLAATCR